MKAHSRNHTCFGQGVRLAFTFLAGLGVGFSAAHAQAADEEFEKFDDNDILEAVETELRFHDAVPHHLMDVQVRAGVVTLSGKSNTLLGKRYATRLAASLKGVRAVVNRVRVLPSGRSDKEVLADVQAAVSDDPVADGEELRIKVSGGRVTLEGTVDSFPEKRLVETAVAGVQGVTEIDNQITVLVKTTRSDGEIKPEILRRFERHPFLAPGLIEAEVEDGVVTLSGIVGSVNEKSIAGTLCWVAGVREVDDSGLEVKWWLDRKRFGDSLVAFRNDAQIQQGVKDALLYDPRVRGMKITVRCRKGAVSLLGNVTTLAAKRAAEEDAKNTLGVRRVINHLKVTPSEWPGDAAVTQAAEEALRRDAVLSNLGLRASSHFGKVYLSGVVNTHFEKGRAEVVSANLPGTLDVINRITVDFDWQPKRDDEIQEDVERRLRWSPLLDADRITVSVADGVVTLEGTVDIHQQRDAAIKHAHQGGARRVTDKLKVRSDRTRPSGLKATLVPRLDVYYLAADQSGEAFRRLLQTAKRSRGYQRLPPAPEVNLVLKLHNQGDRPVDVRLGHDKGEIEMSLTGEGAVYVPLARAIVADFRSGRVVTIQPGSDFEIPIRSLECGFRNASQRWYWTQPGPYMLQVTLSWPADVTGFSMNAVAATPIELTVKEKGDKPR